MANPAPNLVPSGITDQQAFWKPIAAHPNVEVSQLASGVEESSAAEHSQSSTLVRHLLSSWHNASVQTIASGLAFVAGGACIVAAAITSFVFKATNLVDWQAVQLWRIEWLLAAIAILLAGILLKKN